MYTELGMSHGNESVLSHWLIIIRVFKLLRPTRVHNPESRHRLDPKTTRPQTTLCNLSPPNDRKKSGLGGLPAQEETQTQGKRKNEKKLAKYFDIL